MPELHDLLQSAADDVIPGPPAFGDVQRRSRHRLLTRRLTALAGISVVSLGVGSIAYAVHGDRSVQPAALPAPCVAHTDLNRRDVFAAIPQSGTQDVTLMLGDTLTVGWLTCSETGDIVSSDGSSPQAHLARPGGGLTVDTTDVASVRFGTFELGKVTLTGNGSAGSDGVLDITIVRPVEPVGPSEPSPYPGPIVEDGNPDFCNLHDVVDTAGRITRTVDFFDGEYTLTPPGGVTSPITADQILQRYRAGEESRGADAKPIAVFGLLSSDFVGPFPKDVPSWVVVACNATLGRSIGGAMQTGPTAAPGTSPSPGGTILGELVVTYTTLGDRYGGYGTAGYPDVALLAEQLFEVPFIRTHDDSSDGRQIGISYTTDDSCAAFDHLDVHQSQDDPVDVQVWLRLLPGHTTCTGAFDRHDAVVGLTYPLGDRALVRGVYVEDRGGS